MTNIKTNMASNVTVESADTVSYLDRNGNWITESKNRSFGSDHSAVQDEPAPAATYGGYERTEIHFGYEDSAEAAILKEGEFIQARLRELTDKNGNLKPEHYDRAVALSARLEQLNLTHAGDAELRRMRAEREARGQAAPGGLLYEANEKGETVTVFHGEPSLQDQFHDLSKSVTARIDAELKGRRGY